MDEPVVAKSGSGNILIHGKPIAEPHATNMGSDLSTLSGVIRKLFSPLRPRLFAYLISVLFTVVLACYEINRVNTIEDTIPPSPPDSLIAQHRTQMMYDPDGTRWVMYTQKAWDEGSLRLPHWMDENGYNGGYSIGWSSPPMWWLESLAYIRHWSTGEEMKCAIAEISPHYNTFLWILASITMGGICILAYGWRGAFIMPTLYASLCFSKFGIYSPDHHLWILIFGLGMFICLTAPYVSEKHNKDRLWFIGAAIFAGFGFWISAPSQALITIGIFVGFFFIPRESSKCVDPSNWRLFGELSAILSLAVYLFEFYPNYSMRIELNNPVYAAGILVAGIWFWQAQEFVASGMRWSSLQPRPLVYSALFLFITTIPLIIYLPYCFSLADPYYARWESQIAEEQPLNIFSFIAVQNTFLFAAFAAGVINMIIRWKTMSHGIKATVSMCSGFICVYGYFALSHNRFSETVICGVIIITCLAFSDKNSRIFGRVLIILLVLVGLNAINTSRTLIFSSKVYGLPQYFQNTYNLKGVSESILKIAKSTPGGVLAPSNDSNIINYFTQFPVYGPAIYDNKEGLRFTYSIFYYETPKEQPGWGAVRAMLSLGRVRYIAIPKEFGYDTSYMIYDQARIIDPRFCFAYYLIHTDADKFAPWLKLEKDDEKFRIFSVHTETVALANEEKGKR